VKFSALEISATTILIIWFIWISVQLPTSLGSIPIFSLVTTNRAATVFGIIATLYFAYLTVPRDNQNQIESPIPKVIATLSGLLAALLTFVGGQGLSLIVPRLGDIRIIISTALIFLVIFALLIAPLQKFGLALLAVFSVLMAIDVNPLQKSTAGITNGVAITKLLSLSSPESTWASDSNYVDAIFMANSIDSLSGQQLIGPNTEVWQVLDPDNLSEGAWNRGASYITFTWSQLSNPEITSPYADVIQVSISPCVLAEKFNSLKNVVSTNVLEYSCLSKEYEFVQNGFPMNIYKIN
jgi:hypothetical protein